MSSDGTSHSPQRLESFSISGPSPFRNQFNFDRLKSEKNRLETFKSNPNWPVNFIKPEDCASTGFFFLQDADKVQCAFCRGVAGEWEPGDIPSLEHRRHFPRCPFICNLPVGNIPLEEEESGVHRQIGIPQGVDICGTYDVFRPFPGQDHGITTQVRGAQPLSGNIEEVANNLAIKTCSGPAHPNFVTSPSRLKTYVNWPSNNSQTPETMSEAGFFYIGTRDHVKCFYCDGGLRNWEINDDPWFEHARWFPNCTFVQLNKGDAYIKDIKERRPPIVPKGFKIPNSCGAFSEPRPVSDEELRIIIDTPIVKAALDMGMEVNKVKGALRRKLQQTGQPFLTTEALLEAILGREDSEYFSDSYSESEDIDDEEEQENLSPNYFQSAPQQQQQHHQQQQPVPIPSSSLPSSSFNSNISEFPPELQIGEDVIPPTITSSSSASSTVSTASSEGVFHIEVSNSSSSSGGEEDYHQEGQEEENKEKDKLVLPKSDEAKSFHGDSGVGSCSSQGTSDDEDVQGAQNNLEEEIRRLREARMCKICMDNEVGVVFLPCGHLVSCIKCATALSNCALCRQPIKAIVRTYLS